MEVRLGEEVPAPALACGFAELRRRRSTHPRRCLPLRVSPPFSFSHGAHRGKREKKTPTRLVARATGVSTLPPYLKRSGARGDANSLGCPRFDRQSGRGGTRLRRAGHASEERGAGAKG
jgi:hypothetical protein